MASPRSRGMFTAKNLILCGTGSLRSLTRATMPLTTYEERLPHMSPSRPNLGAIGLRKLAVFLALLPVWVGLPPSALSGEAGPESRHRWEDTADLGLVLSSGNTSNTNISINNLYAIRLGKSRFEFKTRLLRVDATRTDLVPDFQTDPPQVYPVKTRSRTTDQFEILARINRSVHARLGWFAFSSWERNPPAGLSGRLTSGGGLSYTLACKDWKVARIEAGLDGTREIPVQGETQSYLGTRLAGQFEREMTPSTRAMGSLELLENLQDTNDFRMNIEAGVAVAINTRLALKTVCSMKYDHQPRVKIFPNPQNGPPALYEYEPLDRLLSTSLVMKF